jgi:hypothetical protein
MFSKNKQLLVIYLHLYYYLYAKEGTFNSTRVKQTFRELI